jgi:hypothetical protein
LYKFSDEVMFETASDLMDGMPCACNPTSVSDEQTDIPDLIRRVSEVLGVEVWEEDRFIAEDGTERVMLARET